MEIDAHVHVRIRGLLVGQLDVAADAVATGLARSPVGRLHDSGPTTGDHRESEFAHRSAHPPGQFVGIVALGDTGRSEDRDARPDEMQTPEAADQFAGDTEDRAQFPTAEPRTLEESEIAAPRCAVGGAVMPVSHSEAPP